MRAVVLALLFLASMLLARPGRAEQALEELPPELRVPADDPRKGPRLEYLRGSPKCPDEKRFRREVAYWVDGRDHLAADSPDVVRVQFTWTPAGYVATVAYTDAAGHTTTLKVTKEGREHCSLLARWAALKVSQHIPDKPPPEPCPVCPACPERAACPPCVASCPPLPPPPKPPWYMDLTVGLRAYGMMTSLLTANVGGGVGVGVDVMGEIISVSGEVRVVLPGRVYATEPVPGATSYFPVEFDLSQFTALVVPCARYKYLVGCAVVQAGFFGWKSTVSEGTFATWGVGPRLGFEVPFAQRFSVFGFGEALFSPQQSTNSFTLPPPGDPNGPVANTRWRQSAVAGFFSAGLSIRFQ